MPATFTISAVTSEWTYEDEGAKVTGKTVYRIFASEPTSPGAAAAATGLPGYGADYPGTTGRTYRTKMAVTASDQTRMLFRAECDYDSTATAFAGSPLDQPVKVSVSNEHAEESYYKDESSTPKYAIHYNKRPFDELPKRDRSIRVLTLEKNVAATTTFDAYDAIDNTVNASDVTIGGTTYAAGTLRVAGVDLSETKTENDTDYKVLKSTLKANRKGWNQHFESRGLVDIDGKPKALDDGKPSDIPCPLYDDGSFKTFAEAGADIELKPYADGDHSILV